MHKRDDDEVHAQLHALVQARGVRPTADLLGLHQLTLLRFMAKVPLRPASRLLVRAQVQHFVHATETGHTKHHHG